MPELDLDTLKELLRLGSTMAQPQAVTNGQFPYALVPEGFSVQNLDDLIFNRHAKAPERIMQKVGVLDPESFIEYYNLFADENSRTFAYEPECTVTTILDYHGAKEGGPRWGDHQIKLTLRKSPEWERWTGKNNHRFTQQEFAEFLEQNSVDITTPAPAAMMEVARDLDATTEVQFGAGLRMNNGQVRFKYTEVTTATVGGDAVTVPERFTLGLPVFVGGQRIAMEALMRFRVKDGHLILFYALIRPEEVLRQAFLAARDQIATALKIVVVNGNAG